MGFCIFNNVAAAAAVVRRSGAAERVLIVDWDVHHGNGTQDAFFADDRILYFSSHQSPCYPGTGRAADVGTGAGQGYTVNVPLPPGCGNTEYISAFHEILVPVARRFEPDLILVSAGFDAYAEDPLAAMRVTPRGFAELGRIVRSLAPGGAPDRIGILLEGGYSLTGLGECLVAAVQALLLDDTGESADLAAPVRVPGPVSLALATLRRTHEDRWWS